jgi:putative transposase
MLTGTPGHLKTFSYLGLHRYSLAFRTDHRRHLLVSPAVVGLVLKQISRAAAENQFAVLAYCFMPDHLHLLIEGRSDASDCKRFMARAKQYSAFYFSRIYRRVLWQRYGFEHVLQDDEASETVARHIMESPIRAGLVRRVEDYPYVGSLEYPSGDPATAPSASKNT